MRKKSPPSLERAAELIESTVDDTLYRKRSRTESRFRRMRKTLYQQYRGEMSFSEAACRATRETIVALLKELGFGANEED